MLGGRSVARHFESPLEGRPRALNIWALPHRREGKIDSVDVVEVRGKILTGYMPGLLAEFIVGMWRELVVSTFDFVFCTVRLLPGSELPDRAAAPQTAQVYALLRYSPRSRASSMQAAPLTNLRLF